MDEGIRMFLILAKKVKISQSNLFHSFIAYGKNEFSKDTVRQNGSQIQTIYNNLTQPTIKIQQFISR